MARKEVSDSSLRNQQIRWVAGAKAGVREDAEKLIRSMSGFLYAMAYGYTRNPDLVDDLYSEACVAVLTKAVPNFDASRGYTFLSYAVFWARAYMAKYNDDNLTPIRLPANLVPLYKKMKAGKKLATTKKNELDVASYEFLCGDKKSRIDEKKTLWDFIPSGDDGVVSTLFEKDEIRKIAESIPREDFDLLVRYIGDENSEPATFGDLADVTGLSKEGVRQRIRKTLKRVRTAKEELDAKEAEQAEKRNKKRKVRYTSINSRTLSEG